MTRSQHEPCPLFRGFSWVSISKGTPISTLISSFPRARVRNGWACVKIILLFWVEKIQRKHVRTVMKRRLLPEFKFLRFTSSVIFLWTVWDKQKILMGFWNDWLIIVFTWLISSTERRLWRHLKLLKNKYWFELIDFHFCRPKLLDILILILVNIMEFVLEEGTKF